MDHFVNRRMFLRLSGMTLALGFASSSLARRLSAPTRRTGDLPGGGRNPTPQAQLDTPLMLTIFLRGGADGLNITIPTEAGEYALYQGFRRTLQVPMASMSSAGTLLTDAGGADLQWGLNPAASELMPLWQDGSLIVMPDVHYDNGSRSHFDSQQFYENGTPYDKFTPDGWANRHLRTSGSGDPLLRAIAFETYTPFALQGGYPTLTFSSLSGLSVTGNPADPRNERYLATQEIAYPIVQPGPRTYDEEVGVAGKSLVDAIRWIQSVSPLPDTDAGAAAIYAGIPNGARNSYFGDRLKDLAKLIKSNAFSIEMAEIDLHGWDTHQTQDAPVPANSHPVLLETLARGIRAFAMDVGDQFMQNIVIFVVSEFGRTTRENGSLGTDHGSAGVSFVVGHPSKVLGRRVVHGAAGWAGLGDLRENRDLKHSTDYRDVVSEIVARHLGNSSPEIFPGWTPTPMGLLA